MNHIIEAIGKSLSIILKFCYAVTDNYGLSIILFTVVTKIILFPLGLLIQKNSIKMVKMQPEINALKIKYIDDKDKFVDEQIALYKRNKYHSYLGIFPLVIQLIMVLGLLDIIYKPLSYLLNIDTGSISILRDWLINTTGIKDAGKSVQIEIIHHIQNGPVFLNDISEGIINAINGFSLEFCGLNLGITPTIGGELKYLIIPLLSGLSAWLLCEVQNRVSVMQMTAGNINKYGTTIFMIAFSVYFSFLVPSGVGLYWIFGNLLAVPSQLMTNIAIPPRKHIDLEYLKRMQEQKLIKEEQFRKYHKKEKADYRRFFSVQDMQLMIYSESNGFYKYYAGMIDYICEHSDIQIHYVTSDPEDNIFKDTRDQIHSYYVSQDKYLIPLFMKLNCDMCIMTMPDLEKYHLKRSRVRKDIEYVYISHGIGSNALTLRKGALDWYDTVFCVGPDSEKEIREMEEMYGTRKKLLIEAGYMLLDGMIESYIPEESDGDRLKILIAPSWQPDNIIELCIDELLSELLDKNYDVILRPHPQMVRQQPEKFEVLHSRYDGTNIIVQTDFSQNSPVMKSDILITDWSDISFEFAFVTKRPVLFINTPMKVMNPDYDKINTIPVNIALRSVIGESMEVSEISNITTKIQNLADNRMAYRDAIEKTLQEHVYNVGMSRKIYGRYVIRSISGKSKC